MSRKFTTGNDGMAQRNWIMGVLSLLFLGAITACTAATAPMPTTAPTDTSLPASPTATAAPSATLSPTVTQTATPRPTATPNPDLSILFVAGKNVPEGMADERFSDAFFLFGDLETLQFHSLEIVPPLGPHLAISPNGRYLAYLAIGEHYGVALADLRTQQVTFLTQNDGEYFRWESGGPTWSPDSRYLVVPLRTTLDCDPSAWCGSINLVQFDIETGERQQLTNSHFNDLQPSWSPDGKWIAFTRFDGEACGYPFPIFGMEKCNHAEFYLLDVQNKQEVFLSDRIHANDLIQSFPEQLDYLAPSWSPDSEKLVLLVGEKDSRPDIGIIDIQTKALSVLVADSVPEMFPAWSPDGTRIAFTRGYDPVGPDSGNDEIFVVNIDGSGLTNLTNHRKKDAFPVWSPDGSKIAFLSNRESGFDSLLQLYVMNADGSHLTKFSDELTIWRPVWLSDSTILK